MLYVCGICSWWFDVQLGPDWMRMLRNEPRLWRHFHRLLFLAMAAPWRTDCLMPLFFLGGGCCTYESVKIGDMKTLARIFSSRENFSLSDIPLSLPSSSFFHSTIKYMDILWHMVVRWNAIVSGLARSLGMFKVVALIVCRDKWFPGDNARCELSRNVIHIRWQVSAHSTWSIEEHCQPPQNFFHTRVGRQSALLTSFGFLRLGHGLGLCCDKPASFDTGPQHSQGSRWFLLWSHDQVCHFSPARKVQI